MCVITVTVHIDVSCVGVANPHSEFPSFLALRACHGGFITVPVLALAQVIGEGKVIRLVLHESSVVLVHPTCALL